MKAMHRFWFLFMILGAVSPAMTHFAWASPVPGKGTLTLTGEIGAGQKNRFAIRKCPFNEYYVQDRVLCQKMPFELELNKPTLLDAGVYSVHGPYNSTTGSQALGIYVNDGQEVQLALKPLKVPQADKVKFRMFLDLTSATESYKMALGIWSSQANDPYVQMSCYQSDAFSQYVCNAWQTPNSLFGAMCQVDTAANYYFIHQNALRDAGNSIRFVNLGKVYVNDLVDTGTTISVFPGTYGIQYVYENGTTVDRLGIVVK